MDIANLLFLRSSIQAILQTPERVRLNGHHYCVFYFTVPVGTVIGHATNIDTRSQSRVILPLNRPNLIP